MFHTRSPAYAAQSCSRDIKAIGLLYGIALWVGITTVALMIALFAMLYSARAILRPASGDWATTLRAGPLQMEVGMVALIQGATAPWIARQLHGRSLPTRMGDLHVAWSETAQELSLHCEPCTFRSSSWGSEPVRLQGGQMTVRRNATELRGTLQSGTVSATWNGTLHANGITLHIDVPITPVRDGYSLFANAIPEFSYAHIDGSFAFKATLELPSRAVNFQPRLEGMRVQGLGTEAWAQAQSQCSQGLPASAKKSTLRTDSLLARAVLAAEDQRFYEHVGYDLVEMNKALRSNQIEDATLRGASTLSQQVAKLLVTGGERSPVRKLRELLYAVEMEQTLGKARILHLYLNNAPWGANVCGAQAAAHTYFGKRADQLSAAQAIWLAAMLHNPNLEALRWKANGQINLRRAQWVAQGIRNLPKRERSASFEALIELVWVDN
jgi:Transglycosylase